MVEISSPEDLESKMVEIALAVNGTELFHLEDSLDGVFGQHCSGIIERSWQYSREIRANFRDEKGTVAGLVARKNGKPYEDRCYEIKLQIRLFHYRFSLFLDECEKNIKPVYAALMGKITN